MNKQTINVLIFMLFACVATSTRAGEQPYPDPPEWVKDKVCYEVNLRQFSAQGNLAGFREHLPRLKELGVGILWFMPIHPIGVEARSGTLGSPYAVRDYTAFNPEFGTIEEFKEVVKQAHELGMYVILDWVPNHTAPDHPWVKQHPDWYTRDESGQLVPPIPLWADVVDLNFDALDMRQAMIDAMAYWVREADIDGFRCDTAEWQPLDFWVDARDHLRAIKPVFMLAEGAKPELIDYAFDAAYAWDLTPNLEKIAHGEKDVTDLVNYLNAEARIVPGNGFRLNFTTNHDINAWEGTTETRLKEGLDAFTVLTYTVAGMPLIYTGQEAGMNRQLPFFESDPIAWQDSPKAKLYQTLAQIKHENPALWHGSEGGAVEILHDATNEKVLTIQRVSQSNRIVVALNLSPSPQKARITHHVKGLKLVLGQHHAQEHGNTHLEPWAYCMWTN